MKTINLRAQAAPIGSINPATKFKFSLLSSLLKLNKFLPDDCKIKTKSDAYYVGTVFFICLSLVIPIFLIATVYCLARAKKLTTGMNNSIANDFISSDKFNSSVIFD